MHPNNESVSLNLKSDISRRGLVTLGGLLCGLALVPSWGCALLGIEDPNANKDKDENALPPGACDFEHLVVTLNLDTATWQWLQLDDPNSSLNGSIVVGIPVTAQNNDELARVLNYMYCKVTAPSGEAQPDISGYYNYDDILQQGSISPGSSTSGVLHVLYRGAGTYTLQFDNLLGSKASLSFEMIDSSAAGIHAVPPSYLSEDDAWSAIPYGNQFDVSGLTLTFSTDEASYNWTQTWDEYNPDWDGRWCVGVPLTITNYSSEPRALTIDMYGLYAPDYTRVDDPAPWFEDSSAAYTGVIEPGQTVETNMYWPYYFDGQYYAAFDNNGSIVIATARIAQYE